MPRTLTGRSISVPEPNWKPLIELIGLELVDWFMWMFAIELSDGTLVHAYKHRTTRRYFHLSEDGRAFAYIPRYSYLQIASGGRSKRRSSSGTAVSGTGRGRARGPRERARGRGYAAPSTMTSCSGSFERRREPGDERWARQRLVATAVRARERCGLRRAVPGARRTEQAHDGLRSTRGP